MVNFIFLLIQNLSVSLQRTCLFAKFKVLDVFRKDYSIPLGSRFGVIINSSSAFLNLRLFAKTCGDIYTQRATLCLMDKEFGFKFMLGAYLGLGSNVVQPSRRGETKSIGAERLVHQLPSDLTPKLYSGHSVLLVTRSKFFINLKRLLKS